VIPTRTTLLLAAALLSPAVVLADVAPGNPWRPAGTGGPVAVYRGTRTNVPPTIPVYRGSSAAAHQATVETPAVAASPELLAAGNRLWIVDRDAGTLTACRLGATTRIGRDRVRCTRRDLPGD
jgi:hypothetical protein